MTGEEREKKQQISKGQREEKRNAFGQWTRRGRCPVEYRGNLYVRLFVCVCLSPLELLGMLQPASQNGRTNGRMDRRTHRFPLYFSGYHPLWVRCPAYLETAIAMLMGRARVPLTGYCLWATGFIVIRMPIHNPISRVGQSAGPLIAW